MNTTPKLIALTLSIALGAGAGLAQEDRDGRDPQGFFDRFDADGDGLVTAEEIEAARDARFAEIDADGDGSVSQEEFVAHAGARASDRAVRMFERLDADGDGMLSRDAIEAQGRRGPGERMISRLDSDGDGAVSAEEFEEGRDRMAERRGMHGDKHGGKGHRTR